MEHAAETAWSTWTAPECPFQVEYSTRVLDDIRLAVVDAFFSLPRGGAEIGGVLLGTHDGGQVRITDYEPLECEHAMGPSFTLSPKDQARLADTIAKARRNNAQRQPVGWYHSHTRSEIFLSETDQDIHKRFFPEPWQLALVLKPHTFNPTRAGFFFREADGSIRGTASYQEFVLAPLPMAAAAVADGVAVPAAPVEATAVDIPPVPEPAEKRRVPITRELPVAKSAPPENDAAEPERSWKAVKAAAYLALGLAAGAIGYQTRGFWVPRAISKARAVLPREPKAYLSLSVSDENGQLKIRWDPNSPAVREAVDGALEISDGRTTPQFIRLNEAQLAAGTFSYARQNERVDVTLLTSEPSGQNVKEQTSFLGRLPGQKTDEPAQRSQRDADTERAEKLQKDLNSQAAKTRKLEKDLKQLQDQLKSQKQPDKQE